jgi:hypothetical protein
MDDPYTPSLGSARTTFLPLPGGEGWGEGEERLRYLNDGAECVFATT